MGSPSLLLSAFLLLTLAQVFPSEAQLPLDVCPLNPLGPLNYPGEQFRACVGLCRTACKADERSDGLCYRSKCLCCIKDLALPGPLPGGGASGGSPSGSSGKAPGGKPPKCRKNKCGLTQLSPGIGEPFTTSLAKCKTKCKAKKELTVGTCGSGSCSCCVPKIAVPFKIKRELEEQMANEETLRLRRSAQDEYDDEGDNDQE
ncbi:uncharacterized protein LOC135196845 [Macrobrachium nipponense]|uniref:uncharacterized protein LOC135196845 n=1 Tax=Macrobrachium nipponense TaxID=159736 RepID=UPI0030C8B633